MKKVLFIGLFPPPLGGVSILSNQLYNYLKVRNQKTLQIDCINISDTIGKVKFYMTLLKKILFNDTVTIQYTSNIFDNLCFFIYILCKLFNKRLIVRVFGGSCKYTYESMSKLKRRLYNNTILKAEVILFETKENVNYFRKISTSKIEWFPNNKEYIGSKKESLKKICFFGQIKKSKGVLEIFQASDKINSNISIDLYGPLGFDISKEEMDKLNNIHKANYRGCVDSREIINIMKEYDLLILPTYYEGEGYPGCIIEAYSIGIPVISTKWRCIPEIVDEECGILIEPKDIESLSEKINFLASNPLIYSQLVYGANNKGRYFDSKRWNSIFIDLL